MRLLPLLLVLASFARAAGVELYSKERLEAASAAGRSVLIQFYAAGCPVCDEQVQALKRIAASGSLSVPVVLQADLNSEPELAGKYKVRAPSTLLLLKNGRSIGRSTGTSAEDGIRAFLREAREAARGRPGRRPRRDFFPKR